MMQQNSYAKDSFLTSDADWYYCKAKPNNSTYLGKCKKSGDSWTICDCKRDSCCLLKKEPQQLTSNICSGPKVNPTGQMDATMNSLKDCK